MAEVNGVHDWIYTIGELVFCVIPAPFTVGKIGVKELDVGSFCGLGLAPLFKREF